MSATKVLQKRWRLKKADKEAVRELHQGLGIHKVLCRLLVQRGITGYEAAKHFFRPSYERLHDPFAMKDMDKAVGRITQAIEQHEKVLVYGDYDVDGTTAVALTYRFFRRLHPMIDYYIPDRYNEGYGLSRRGIDYAVKQGCKLLIALDCGIKAVDMVKYARDQGLDVIICDHHLPGKTLPPATAILDPKQPGCAYPYNELSGCGIGFKLAQAYTEFKKLSTAHLNTLLDLVAVSTAADIVPMTGENRLLTQLGLEKLNTHPMPGLAALMEVSGLRDPEVDKSTGEVAERELQTSDIVFGLAPRINAAGRMKDARQAVKLLASDNMETARSAANLLDITNEERRTTDRHIQEEAAEMLRKDPTWEQRKSTVLYHPKWHKGVVGIVASRVIEKHCYRPTIILTGEGDKVSGSARSVPGFNVYEAIEACAGLLEQFGGHRYAAGLTMKAKNVERFCEAFENAVAERINDALLTPQIVIDAELDFADITPRFFRVLQQFAPFGPGNLRPVFLSRGVQDTGHSRIVGEDHLKLAVRQSNSTTLRGIAFNRADAFEQVSSRKPFDICYTLRENRWNGKCYIELQANDLRKSQRRRRTE